MNLKKAFALVAAMTSLSGVMAGPAYISKALQTDPPSTYGSLRAESYDVAIHLGEEYAGAKIKAVRVPIAASENYSKPGAFLSKKLNTVVVDNKRYNDPDICSVEGEISDGYLTAAFSTPYTIESDGVYVGFSFTIDTLDELNRKPLIGTNVSTPDGFWLRGSSSHTRWGDETSVSKFTTGMCVLLESDKFQEISFSPKLSEIYRDEAGKPFVMSGEVVCWGGTELKDLEFSWMMGEEQGKGKISLSKSTPVVYGYSYPVDFVINSNSSIGLKDFGLQLTKANGQNLPNDASTTTQISVVSKIPRNRPLVEEYTGTWCGYCTNGIASFEYMHRVHSYDFIGAVYHHGLSTIPDPMQVTITDPNTPAALPAAYINRVNEKINPYYGPASSVHNTTKTYGFEEYWNQIRNQFTPADIELACSWGNQEKTLINSNATVTFVEDTEGEFGLGWLLVSDLIQNPTPEDVWVQQNSNQGLPIDIPEIEKFSNGGMSMINLDYSDVALRNSGANILAFNDPFATDVPQTLEFTIDAGQIKGFTGVDLIQNPENLRVIAFVVNKKNGEVLNASQWRMNGENGINPIGISQKEVVSELWYDLSGNRLAAPLEKGLSIKLEINRDGSKTSKKILK